ncbi:MAG: hypothetical protein ACKOAH_16965, partial [Pirellula sp.]
DRKKRKRALHGRISPEVVHGAICNKNTLPILRERDACCCVDRKKILSGEPRRLACILAI